MSGAWHSLIHYRERSFIRAHELLASLNPEQECLDALLELQALLVDEITRAETQIARYNSQLRATGGANSRAEWLERRIEGYRQLIFLWRCFGDAVVFKYLDRHSIKHAFYRTTSGDPKQPAGFLSGKDGFAGELAALKRVTDDGFPCILSDLTNCVRYGDLCVLVGPEPYFIEVKSSKVRSQRRQRQVADIRKLHDFFDTDKAINLRGASEIRRVAVHSDATTHLSALNECLTIAEKNGSCVVSPEDGLHYVAIYDGNIDAILQDVDMQQCSVYVLNSFKSARSWAPYSPFTLSIASARHVYDFFQGTVFLLVIVNLETLRAKAERTHIATSIGPKEEALIQYELKNGIVGGMSKHFIDRIAFEFISLEWIAQQLVATAESHMTSDPKDDA